MLLRVNANPQVADIHGNTPLHFFALAAAEEGVIKGDAKNEKGTTKQKEERNKAKRNADVIEALVANKKCQNWYGNRNRIHYQSTLLMLAFQQRRPCTRHHHGDVGQA
jgi:hypothetical protein